MPCCTCQASLAAAVAHATASSLRLTVLQQSPWRQTSTSARSHHRTASMKTSTQKYYTEIKSPEHPDKTAACSYICNTCCCCWCAHARAGSSVQCSAQRHGNMSQKACHAAHRATHCHAQYIACSTWPQHSLVTARLQYQEFVERGLHAQQPLLFAVQKLILHCCHILCNYSCTSDRVPIC